jgi:hypothetical protein
VFDVGDGGGTAMTIENPDELTIHVLIVSMFFCIVGSSVYALHYEDEDQPELRTECKKLNWSEFRDIVSGQKVLDPSAGSKKVQGLDQWWRNSKYRLVRAAASMEEDSETNLHLPAAHSTYKLKFDGKEKPADFPEDPAFQEAEGQFSSAAIFGEIDRRGKENEQNEDPANENFCPLLCIFTLWYLGSGRNLILFCLLLKWHAWELQNLNKKFDLMRIFISEPGSGKDLLFQHFLGAGVWRHLYAHMPDIAKLVDVKDNFNSHGFKLKVISEFNYRLSTKVQQAIKARITDPATTLGGMYKDTVFQGVFMNRT